MTKTVTVYSSVEEADQAEERYYAEMSQEERTRLFFELILPKDRSRGVVERSVRIYPVPQPTTR